MNKPMAETALATAMRKAGISTERPQLYVAAIDALRRRGGDPAAALDDFVTAITATAAMLVELMGAANVRAAALGYLRSRAAEMNNGAPVKQAAGGLMPSVSMPLRDNSNGAGSGHAPGGDHTLAAAPSTETTAGRLAPDARPSRAAPSSANREWGSGRPPVGAQSLCAAPAREPSSTDRRASASVARQAARSVLDSFKVRDGRAIGDVTWKEVESIRTTNVREAAVLRQIQKRVAHADGDARIRDLISAEDLARIVQKAAEAADAA